MTFSLLNRVSLSLKSLVADVRGVAAVEFAYIAPLLILALFGTLEVSRGVMMHKRFQRISAMIGDLVSREQTVGTAPGGAAPALNGMMLSANQVMAPFSLDTLKMTISSLRANMANPALTAAEWSYQYPQKSASSTCEQKAMPASGMLTAGNTAIVVESKYTYKPLLAKIVPGFDAALEWNDTITHSPRKASCVAFEGQNCGMLCPGW